MRYLKEAPVLDRDKKPLTIRAKEVDGKPQLVEETWVSLLSLILGGYQPTQGFQLSTGDKRLLLKVLDVLDGEPSPDGGYLAFEDAHYAVLKRVVENLSPQLVGKLALLGPTIEDFVNDMPTETPAQAKAKADAALIAEAAKATAAKQPVGA